MIRDILIYVSLSAFVILALLVINRLRILKAKYGFQSRDGKYVRLPQMKRRYLVGNFNRVYENRLDSKHIIDQFILSVEGYQPFLLCHFVKGHITTGTLEINMFDGKERLIHTYYVDNIDDFKRSDVMALPRKTTYVNIYYHKNKNHDDHDRMCVKRTVEYKKVARLESIAMFAFLLPATDLLFTLAHDRVSVEIYELWYFYFVLATMVWMCMLNYLVISYRLEKKSEQGEKQ